MVSGSVSRHPVLCMLYHVLRITYSPCVPGDHSDDVCRGISYDKMGRYESAVADFTLVLQLDPQNVNAVFNRGSSYDSMGQYDKAVADYSRALDLDASVASSGLHNGTCPRPFGILNPLILSLTDIMADLWGGRVIFWACLQNPPPPPPPSPPPRSGSGLDDLALPVNCMPIRVCIILVVTSP